MIIVDLERIKDNSGFGENQVCALCLGTVYKEYILRLQEPFRDH